MASDENDLTYKYSLHNRICLTKTSIANIL